MANSARDADRFFSEMSGRAFSRRANNRFATMLAIVMPGSLLVTWLWKQYEIMAPRSRWQVADEWPVPQDEVDIRRIVYRAPPVPTCDDDERAALRRIGWWNETVDNCCRWKGIKCSQGRVTKVSLAGGKVRGTLPNELARLGQLQVLDLNENPSLSGTLPEQLGRLDSLANVYLFGSALSGSLPDLGGCAALQELELSHCRLSGTLPASLGRASKLQYLFLESNGLSGTLPAALGRLRGLKELELSENRLSGSVPSALRARSLSHLDLQKNPRLKGVPQASAKSQCSGGSDKYLRGPGLQQQSTEADKPSAIQASKSVAKSLPVAADGKADGEDATATAGGQPGKGQG